MATIPVEVPAAELRPGLTVWKVSENGRHYVKDCYLVDYLLTSAPAKMAIRKLQFVTGHNSYATWHNAGRVLVTVGNDNRKSIPRKG